MTKAIIYDWVGTLYERETALFPASKRVLLASKVKEYKIALVSKAGQGIEARWKEIKDTNIEHFFDKIYVGLDKDEDNYSAMIKELGSTPETTFVVGDQVRKDIRIGNNLGCKTIWIRTGGRHSLKTPEKDVEKPDYTITDIAQVLNII